MYHINSTWLYNVYGYWLLSSTCCRTVFCLQLCSLSLLAVNIIIRCQHARLYMTNNRICLLRGESRVGDYDRSLRFAFLLYAF
jgi:hypothetical protein